MKNYNNRTAGVQFEEEFANYLWERKFWVHCLVQAAGGQPADLIAQRKGCVWLVDCKVCAGDRFPLNRVEYNQHRSMQAWLHAGGTMPYFALKLSDNTVRMLSYNDVLTAEKLGLKSIGPMEMNDYTVPIENWLTAIILWESKHKCQNWL